MTRTALPKPGDREMDEVAAGCRPIIAGAKSHRTYISLVSVLLFALVAMSPPAAQPRDWAATLRMDAKALHDDVAANHPGPVNPADPGFEARNDAQLALALKRAVTANSYADYFTRCATMSHPSTTATLASACSAPHPKTIAGRASSHATIRLGSSGSSAAPTGVLSPSVLRSSRATASQRTRCRRKSSARSWADGGCFLSASHGATSSSPTRPIRI